MSGHAPQVFVAPAKINLFLHVVGRRADGYHVIQSAMQLIDLADELTVTVRDDGRIEREGTVRDVRTDDDLMVRAARLLQAASDCALGATLANRKRIPIGGGLGGGSSDAATTLLALNRLWRLDWSRERLMRLGLELGADVPFFVGGDNAFVEGIGERITPLALPPLHVALIHPGVAVPTAAIFGAAELTRNTEVIRILDFSKNGPGAVHAPRASGASDEDDDAVFRNDLEPVAAARFPAIREALSWLSHEDLAGACGPARMSGSGACVFRSFASAGHATACIAALPSGWSGWAVRTLAAHPHRSGAD